MASCCLISHELLFHDKCNFFPVVWFHCSWIFVIFICFQLETRAISWRAQLNFLFPESHVDWRWPLYSRVLFVSFHSPKSLTIEHCTNSLMSIQHAQLETSSSSSGFHSFKMLVASTRSFISDCSNGCLALALVISFILKFWRGQFTSDSHSCLFSTRWS